jgi:hypothetical protein
MSNRNLKNYYDEFYIQVSDAVADVPILITRTPRSCYEAAVKYFPRYLCGGDILEFGPGNGNVAKAFLASDIPISSYTLYEITPAGVKGLR